MHHTHTRLIGYLACAAIAVCMSISFYFASEAVALWRLSNCRYEVPKSIQASGVPFKGGFFD